MGGLFGGGGSSSPAPVTQNVSNTNIPAYAQPYVENMLGQAAALTDINQNPYQTYGGQRIADFSPQQQTAFNRVANQQTAGQIGTGTDLSTAAGIGSLNSANQAGGYGQLGSGYGSMAAGMAPQAQRYGQNASNMGIGGLRYGAQGMNAGMQAAGYGAQGANIGQNVAGMSTDPYAQQAYMSPYIQNALQPQLEEMQRQYSITGQQQRGQAVGAGAFGGTRDSLMRSENERNKNMAMNQAIGTGYNTAFNNAQNQMNQAAQLGMQGTAQGIQGQQAAMQGAGVGLQGINTAMQGQQTGLQGLQQAGNLYGQGMTGAQIGLQGVGAQQAGYAGANQAGGTLGQLGQTQFGQQQAITRDQLTAGAVQQAQAQQALDQQYQDFMKQKNYPYQQLAFMGDMTRGLPLSQTANTMYSAPANAASQLGGLGMSALGIYGMSGGFKADGGMVGKGYAKGGMAYASGGDISMMSTEQLMQLLDSPSLTPLEVSMIEKQIMLRQRMENNPEAGQIMQPRSGIGAISTGDMVPEEGMAGGGIVAFAQGGLKRPSNELDLDALIAKKIAAMETGNPFAKSEAEAESIRKSMAERKERSPYEALTMAGLGTMAGTSPNFFANLGLGGIEGVKNYGRSQAENAADQKLLLQQQVEAEKSRYARDTGNLNTLLTAKGQKDVKEIGLLNAKNSAGANATAKQTAALIQAQNSYNQALDNAKDTLLKQDKYGALYRKDPAAFNREAKREAANSMSPQVLELLGMKPIVESTPPPPDGKKSEPVIVTIPAKDGQPARQIQFESKEKADAFKKAAGIK